MLGMCCVSVYTFFLCECLESIRGIRIFVATLIKLALSLFQTTRL